MRTHFILMGVALLGSLMADTTDPENDQSDKKVLETLNQGYIRSVLTSDVGWFEQHLATDFVCTNPDGFMVNRVNFLKQTALPVGISDFELHDVTVRVMGDFALIHARTTYTRDGQARSSRYTDAWRRQQGGWFAVSAHITPVR